MQLSFSVKQLGKKRPFIRQQHLEIAGEYHQAYSLHSILTHIVKQQVQQFNKGREEKNLLSFLKADQIQEQATQGKVALGALSHTPQADSDQAVEAVLQAFEDGIIAVFLDDQQLKRLDEIVQLTPDSLFTFLRLTFLAGSYW
ncbi:MAG: hypothetical protein AAF587_41715 [Bacteroidota bacterium]